MKITYRVSTIGAKGVWEIFKTLEEARNLFDLLMKEGKYNHIQLMKDTFSEKGMYSESIKTYNK